MFCYGVNEWKGEWCVQNSWVHLWRISFNYCIILLPVDLLCCNSYFLFFFFPGQFWGNFRILNLHTYHRNPSKASIVLFSGKGKQHVKSRWWNFISFFQPFQLICYQICLMMEIEEITQTVVFNSSLGWLITRGDFNEYICLGSLKILYRWFSSSLVCNKYNFLGIVLVI